MAIRSSIQLLAAGAAVLAASCNTAFTQAPEGQPAAREAREYLLLRSVGYRGPFCGVVPVLHAVRQLKAKRNSRGIKPKPFLTSEPAQNQKNRRVKSLFHRLLPGHISRWKQRRLPTQMPGCAGKR